MAVRIFALAKELKLDSKALVDVLAKAGVGGKGSALASLSDEEVDKLKAYLAGGSGKTSAKESSPRAPAPAPSTPNTSTAVAEPPHGGFRREDYIAPGGITGKPPVISRPEKPSGDSPKKSSGDGPKAQPRSSGPGFRVAPLPTVSQPTPTAKAKEPEAQKPDIKLPVDAIRAVKQGATPLADHLRKHEAKKKVETSKPKGGPPPGRGGGAAPPITPPDAEGRDRSRRPKGPAHPPAPDDGLAGPMGREQRQLNRKRTTPDPKRIDIAAAVSGDEVDRPVRRRGPRELQPRSGTNTAAPRKGRVTLQLPCTVRSFSEALGIQARQVLGKLLAMGTMSTINTELDGEKVELLALEFGAEIDLQKPVDLETELLGDIESQQDDPALLVPRPPVVTFLGHVDHGKTSLLDKIIGIDVASRESGGITQHIRAYKIEKDGRPIAFVDTPGHEAFTEMRARGANVTDIAVLVVAADDGVMPQTEEALSHARAAGVPIVVALNKTDLPGINFDRIYTQLVTSGLQPTEWGGDTELVRCSALTGQGIDQLLETLLTISELHDYKANPLRRAYGTCLEAEQHEGRGVVAKFIVQNGTLKVGDVVVCGSASGRIKAMYDTLNPHTTYEEAGPSTPVNITGLDLAPGAGDHFYVLDDITQARSIAEKRSQDSRRVALGGGGATHVTLENLHERLGGDEPQMLNLILRADVRGSIEAIQKELTKLEHPEVQIKILQATVGGVTEADVHLADASDAIIIGFNVVPDEKARILAEQKGVQIRRYDIIYQVTNDLKAALEGMLKPEHRDVDLGRALVQRTFVISRVGTIAGCRVLAGTIERNCRLRVIRENRIIGEYAMDSLKREKNDAKEVREGFECGIKLAGFNDLKEGDILEAYKVEEIARTL